MNIPNELLQNSCDGWVRKSLKETMKTKQLANILIKILGIYFIVEAVPMIALKASVVYFTLKPDLLLAKSYTLVFVALLLQILIALFFLFKSKSIAGFLFKEEED